MKETKESYSFSDSFTDAMIILVLKNHSKKEAPLNAAGISKLLSLTYNCKGNENTVKTHMDKLAEYFTDSTFGFMIQQAFGGCICRIVTTDIGSRGSKKPHASYYFEPLLTVSDISMIQGALESSMFLTDHEKAFLMEREGFLGTPTAYISSPSLTPRPKTMSFSDREKHPVAKTAWMLETVSILHTAIQKKQMLSLIYARYDLPKNLPSKEGDSNLSVRPILTPVNSDHPYTINPYALLWNEGEYYLLATHEGHDNPVHFRVDRIFSVDPVAKKDKHGQILFENNDPRLSPLYQKRSPIPAGLKEFFTDTGVFKATKYTSRYPKMNIYDGSVNLINASFECTNLTLPLLRDSFDPSMLSISLSKRKHSKEESLDLHGNPLTFYIAQVHNVEYENIRRYALQYASLFTVTSPKELTEDVKAELKKCYERI